MEFPVSPFEAKEMQNSQITSEVIKAINSQVIANFEEEKESSYAKIPIELSQTDKQQLKNMYIFGGWNRVVIINKSERSEDYTFISFSK